MSNLIIPKYQTCTTIRYPYLAMHSKKISKFEIYYSGEIELLPPECFTLKFQSFKLQLKNLKLFSTQYLVLKELAVQSNGISSPYLLLMCGNKEHEPINETVGTTPSSKNLLRHPNTKFANAIKRPSPKSASQSIICAIPNTNDSLRPSRRPPTHLTMCHSTMIADSKLPSSTNIK